MLINHQTFINILCQHMSAACNELRKDVGLRATGDSPPHNPLLKGSPGILHSWQGILCGFRRNARLCTGTQGWSVRSPKMQLDGNRVNLSCVSTIIASRCFNLKDVDPMFLSLAQEITELFRRRVPASASSKEHQNHQVAKLVQNFRTHLFRTWVCCTSFSGYPPKNMLHCIITKCTPTSPKMTILMPRKVTRQHQILLPPQRVQPHPILQLRRRAPVCH